jgi:hypothetical protein
MSKLGGQHPPRRSLRASALERAAALSEAGRNLERAEEACERIAVLVQMADEARNAQDETRAQAHEKDAQDIRDRLRDAKWAFEQARAALLSSLGAAAVRDEGALRAFEQMRRLSSYPSARVAGEILELVAALPAEDPSQERSKAFPNWSGIHQLPDKRPSDEDRRQLAKSLRETIEAERRTLASVWEEMRIAEGTLKRLRNAEPVHPESWRKAVSFVRKLHPDRSR